MESEKYRALFATESRDHLQQCNEQLLAWERDPSAQEPLRGLFRSIHTLKGMAATMGFERLTEVAHAFEQLLAGLRDSGQPATPAVLDLAFRATDVLDQGVTLAVTGEDGRLEARALVADLGRGTAELSGPAGPTATPTPGTPAAAGAGAQAGRTVRVRLREGASMPVARATVAFRRLTELGEVGDLTPPMERWTDEGFDGAFTCRFLGTATSDEVHRVLMAAGEVAEVRVEGAATPVERRRQVRVDPGRLDRLLEITGELVVARNRLGGMARQRRDPDLDDLSHRTGRLIDQLQEAVLEVRMAPLGDVFERFGRPIRDLARQLDKAVRLEVSGHHIELDRAMLDELADPLLHLLRNAVDHGIEPVAEREAAGKPAQGTIWLSARRDRDVVVIEVRDDGRGVDESAVRDRAGLVTTQADNSLLDLLARPGFSTARQVTSVSGRGVGIDAVVHWVRRMGGSTELHTAPGQGTSFSLRMPLSVAILPALLVQVARQRYAVPLGAVAETVRLPAGEAAGLVEVNGVAVPLIDLGCGAAPGGAWRPGVMLDVAGRRGALAVDTLLGQDDIVVGPLHAPRGMPAWVNGATILADGQPALILDPAVLVQGGAR